MSRDTERRGLRHHGVFDRRDSDGRRFDSDHANGKYYSDYIGPSITGGIRDRGYGPQGDGSEYGSHNIPAYDQFNTSFGGESARKLPPDGMLFYYNEDGSSQGEGLNHAARFGLPDDRGTQHLKMRDFERENRSLGVMDLIDYNANEAAGGMSGLDALARALQGYGRNYRR